MKPHFKLFIAALAFILVQQFIAAQDKESATYESLVEQALNAARQDSIAQAEELFKQALRTSPHDHRNALIFANIGNLQERTGRNEEALQSYTFALNIVPRSVPILTSRADLYLSLGNFSKAIIDYDYIIEADPLNTHALKCKAFIHTKRREYAEAKSGYTRVLEISPEDYTALLSMVIICQETQKSAEAMSRITLLIEKFPDKAELYSIRADMEQNAQQPELALLDLDKAIALEPENKNYILARAYLHLENGNKYYAKRDFNRAIELGVPRASLKEELRKVR